MLRRVLRRVRKLPFSTRTRKLGAQLAEKENELRDKDVLVESSRKENLALTLENKKLRRDVADGEEKLWQKSLQHERDKGDFRRKEKTHKKEIELECMKLEVKHAEDTEALKAELHAERMKNIGHERSVKIGNTENADEAVQTDEPLHYDGEELEKSEMKLAGNHLNIIQTACLSLLHCE